MRTCINASIAARAGRQELQFIQRKRRPYPVHSLCANLCINNPDCKISRFTYQGTKKRPAGYIDFSIAHGVLLHAQRHGLNQQPEVKQCNDLNQGQH